MSEKTFLYIGDLHAGSAFALYPPRFKKSDGSLSVLNDGQKYLFEVYTQIVEACPDLDGIIYHGDMVDGVNYKETGRFLSEQDPLFQVYAAEELVKPFQEKLKENGRVWVLRGSKYHSGGDHWEEMFGKLVGGEENAAGYHTHAWLRVPLFSDTGLLIDAAHHQSYTRVNKMMPLEREIREAMMKFAKLGGFPFSHLVISRAHTHHGYRLVQDECATGLSLPSLKLQDPFAAGGKQPNGTRPDSVGAVFVTLADEFPYVTLEPILAPHPEYYEEVFE